jgi:hypothetical protein
MEFPTWWRGCTVVSLTGPRSDMPTEPVYCTRKSYSRLKEGEEPTAVNMLAYICRPAVVLRRS